MNKLPAPAAGHSEENRTFAGSDFIIVRVTREAFLFEDKPIAPQREPLRRLAEQLHEHGVKFLWLRPGLSIDEFEQLLTIAAADNKKGFAEALARLALEHIGLEVIENFQLVEQSRAPLRMDMLSYLRSKEARRRAPFENATPEMDELPEDDAEDISDLAEFFLEIAQGSEEKNQYLYNNLSNPRRLAETLTYLAKIAPARQTDGRMSVNLVQQTLGHIADAIKQLSPEVRATMVRNIADAVLTMDKSVSTQVLDGAMAADVGKT
ncbi:MAG: hypothetical protein U9Q79_09530, partial [Candidatus Hydrogenedentes bacterium]|nr:hypothetical protein [Candidatus Hydrogenedentota bacterium]